MGKAFNCTATLSVVTLAAGVTKKLTEKPALGSVTVPPKPKMRCSGVGEMGTRAPMPATLLTPLRLQLTLTMSIGVTPQSTITLPLIGEMSVAGMTEEQFTEALKVRLSMYMHDPPVAVFVKSY